MEEPGRLQSMGSRRVGHNWATSLSLFTFMHWRRKWQPTPVFLPGESQGWGSLVAAVYGVTQSQTRLKWLSSSSSSQCSCLENPRDGGAWWAAVYGVAQSRTQLKWLTSELLSVGHIIGRTDAKAEVPILWPPDARSWLIEKDPDAGKEWGCENRATEDEMVAWHHRLNTHVWANSRRWWRTGKPGIMLQSVESQGVGHNLATEQ